MDGFQIVRWFRNLLYIYPNENVLKAFYLLNWHHIINKHFKVDIFLKPFIVLSAINSHHEYNLSRVILLISHMNLSHAFIFLKK